MKDIDRAFGDCNNCGHSIMYHVPIAGCMKCDCDEYHHHENCSCHEPEQDPPA